MDQFGKSQKIIIVEDNVNLAEIYKTRLEVLGYQVMVAHDGVTALTMIQKEMPNLVLLDLMVPKIAGDQILETMRKSDWGREIPVFIISNLNESDAPAGLRGMGIEGYAVKANLSNDQLDSLVDSILTPVDQNSAESLDAPADNVTDNNVSDQPLVPEPTERPEAVEEQQPSPVQEPEQQPSLDQEPEQPPTMDQEPGQPDQEPEQPPAVDQGQDQADQSNYEPAQPSGEDARPEDQQY